MLYPCQDNSWISTTTGIFLLQAFYTLLFLIFRGLPSVNRNSLLEVGQDLNYTELSEGRTHNTAVILLAFTALDNVELLPSEMVF